jgi:hypothetical protein
MAFGRRKSMSILVGLEAEYGVVFPRCEEKVQQP